MTWGWFKEFRCWGWVDRWFGSQSASLQVKKVKVFIMGGDG